LVSRSARSSTIQAPAPVLRRGSLLALLVVLVALPVTRNVRRGEWRLPGDLHEPHRPGLLRGASGSVTLQGLEEFATLRFTETITGRLCLD
jgi:hypothetical protein